MIKNKPEDIWKSIDKKEKDECWEWNGYIDRNGYGRIAIAGINYATHRLAYELTNGPIPKTLYVLHKCDNRRCCNPSHLYLGTHKDNMKDKNIRMRVSGELNSNSILKEIDVKDIRLLYSTNNYTQKELGEMFGVKQITISNIITNKLWKHI